MGLFDAWQFDPQTFRPGGGLLDQIMQMQQTAQAPGAPQGMTPGAGASQFPLTNIATPDYGQAANVVGSLGPMAVPTFGQADPAQLPQNAQPAQFQQPTQPQMSAQPQESPGIGDRLLAGLQGFTNAGGPLQAIGDMVGGLANGSAPQNQTVKALIARGLDPAIAQQIARDPGMMRAVLPTLLGNTGQTDDIKEYQFAKRENPSLTFEQHMAKKRAVTGEYSLTPQYGTNEKGETVLLQTGKNGTTIQSKLPDGIKVSSGVEKIDAGTHYILYDKRTGTPVGTQPKDVAGAASAKAQGTAQGEATVALPGAIQQAEDALKTIKQTREHKGRDSMLATGGLGWVPGIPGTDQQGFVSLVDQLKGRAFLQAYQAMRGTGSISEVEGLKAEQAQARLNRAQKKEDFDAALDDLETIITRGLSTAKQKAGQSGAASPPPSSNSRVPKFNPATGKIER